MGTRAGMAKAAAKKKRRSPRKPLSLTEMMKQEGEKAEADFIDVVKCWQEDMAYMVETAILAPYNAYFGKNVKMTNQQRSACKELTTLVWDKINGKRKEILGISIMSGKGSGKDAWLSWAIPWFMLFPYAKVACVSVSADQLDKVLWSEISKWISRSLLSEYFTLQADKLFFNDLDEKERGKRWFAFKKAANPRDNEEDQVKTLSGLHEEFLMEVIDEGSGVRDVVFKELETNMTEAANLMLLVFNPNKRSGYAVDSQFKHSKRWVCLNWNTEESEICDNEKIKRIEDDFGRNSNVYRVNVLGQPPTTESDGMVPYEWIIAAVQREIKPENCDPKILALDCGAGGDKSTLCYRHGYKVEWIEAIVTKSPNELCEWVGHYMDTVDADVLYVDSITLGWATLAMLQDMKGSRVIGIDVRNIPNDTNKYFNKRAELYDKMFDSFRNNLISIPDNQELIDELCSIKQDREYTKIKIISKKILRKELGRSTNMSDVLAFTFEKDMDYSSRFRVGAVYNQKSERCTGQYAWMGN